MKKQYQKPLTRAYIVEQHSLLKENSADVEPKRPENPFGGDGGSFAKPTFPSDYNAWDDELESL